MQDIRTFELAVTDVTAPESDKVVAFPKSLVLEAAARHEPIDFPIFLSKLCFATIRRIRGSRGFVENLNLATAGSGCTGRTAVKPGAHRQ